MTLPGRQHCEIRCRLPTDIVALTRESGLPDALMVPARGKIPLEASPCPYLSGATTISECIGAPCPPGSYGITGKA